MEVPGYEYGAVVSRTNWVAGASPSGFFRVANTQDSDGDGLTDAYEALVSGTDSYNASSDFSGVPDGLTWEEWKAHPLWGDAQNAANVRITPVLGEGVGAHPGVALVIGDLVLPVVDGAHAWELRIGEGFTSPFRVVNVYGADVRFRVEWIAAYDPPGAFVADDPDGCFVSGDGGGRGGGGGGRSISGGGGRSSGGGSGSGSSGDVSMAKVSIEEPTSFCQHGSSYNYFNVYTFPFNTPLEWSVSTPYLSVGRISETRYFINLSNFSGAPNSSETTASVFSNVLFGASSATVRIHRCAPSEPICDDCGLRHKNPTGVKACADNGPRLINVNSNDNDLDNTEDRLGAYNPEDPDLAHFRPIPYVAPEIFCCCATNAPSTNAFVIIDTYSSNLRLRDAQGAVFYAGKRIDGGETFSIEAITESPIIEGSQITYKIYDPFGNLVKTKTIKITAANAQILPDYNDDGAAKLTEHNPASAPIPRGTQWTLERRAQPYKFILQNETPSDATLTLRLTGDTHTPPRITLKNATDGATLLHPAPLPAGAATTAPPLAEKNTKTEFHLDASGAPATATLIYTSTQPDGKTLASANFTIRTIDLTMPPLLLPRGAPRAWDFTDITSGITWTVKNPAGTTITTQTTSYLDPSALPVGDYTVTATFPGVYNQGAYLVKTATLKICEITLPPGPYGARVSPHRDERLEINATPHGFPGNKINWSITPALPEGARIHPYPTGGIGGLHDYDCGDTAHISAGTHTNQTYTLRAYHPDNTNICATVQITTLDYEITPKKRIAPAGSGNIFTPYSTNTESDWKLTPSRLDNPAYAAIAFDTIPATYNNTTTLFALNTGTAARDYTITATHHTYTNLTATATLTVATITLDPADTAISLNSPDRLKITATLDNMTVSNLRWELSPMLADGARLYENEYVNTAGFSLSGVTEAWMSSGTLTNQIYTIRAYHNDTESQTRKVEAKVNFHVFAIEIKPDMNNDGKIDASDITIFESQKSSQSPCDVLYATASNEFHRIDFTLSFAPTTGEQVLILAGEQGAFRVYTDTNTPPVAISSPSGTEFTIPQNSPQLSNTFWIECMKPAIGEVTHKFRRSQNEIYEAEETITIASAEIHLLTDTDNNGIIDEAAGGEREYAKYPPGRILIQKGNPNGSTESSPRAETRFRLKPDVLHASGVITLTSLNGNDNVELWTSSIGGNKFYPPSVFPPTPISPITIPSTLWATGDIRETTILSASYSFIHGGQTISNLTAYTTIPPLSESPANNNAFVWSSLPRLQTGDGTIFEEELTKQGFNVQWFQDDDGYGTTNFFTCTLENYKKMAGAGAITIISHGAPGKHQAVYAPPDITGEVACNVWRTGETGMTTELYRDDGGEFFCVEVDTSWLATNWKPSLDYNNAIALWSICYSADISNGLSVKEAAGGRWRGGYVTPTDAVEASGVNLMFLQRMNGTTGGAMMRTAGEAYSGSIGYTSNLQMDGNWWTTLCPAPLVFDPVYPSLPVTEKRKGWGCVLLDTVLNKTTQPPAAEAVEKESGGATVSGQHWLEDSNGKFYGVGFKFDKTSDNSPTTVKAVSDKIRNEGTEGRTMDGDRVQPNTDDKQWSF